LLHLLSFPLLFIKELAMVGCHWLWSVVFLLTGVYHSLQKKRRSPGRRSLKGRIELCA
jgi:hypothetical protein